MDENVDDAALRLRQAGSTFGSIARKLGLAKPRHALLAYNRALRLRPEAEQATLREAEEARLVKIEESLRGREDLTVDERDRRLRSVEQMRAQLRVV